jgi:L-amino acid N-acyltransferase
MGKAWRIRALRAEDGGPVRAIFNDYVENSFAAYTEQPLSLESIQSMLSQTDGYPALSAIAEDDSVIGFSFLRPYGSHNTFAGTVRITTFINPDCTGQGLGAALLERLETEAAAQGIRSILAHISSKNVGSMAFHRRHGFVQCGCFEAIGRKHGQTFDVVWFQKRLTPRITSSQGG